ncbi:MAG: hypothetical protein JOZ81_27625 [Chloroflexi bacterium]|nr:hypothetical protein [Chloroflexota bacterium]
MAKRLLVAGWAALLVAGTAGGVASAQDLPVGAVAADGDISVQQLLAGEASALADFLAISTDQLQHELVGHSLAEVAQQHGKSAADVTAVVVDTAQRELDAAVDHDQVSRETAAGYRAEIAALAPMLVNSAEATAAALQAVEVP